VLDLIVKEATVYTGDGPPTIGDVGVLGGLVAAVGIDLPIDSSAETVDGKGLVLCPGFIDMHAHSALAPFDHPEMGPKVAQGFTTEVINPDRAAGRAERGSGGSRRRPRCGNRGVVGRPQGARRGSTTSA